MTFTFDVQTLSPNAAEISITPSDNTQTWYWTRATDKEFTDANKNKDALFKDMLESDIEYGIQEEGFDRAGAVADITHTGPFNNTLQSLFGSTTYHLLAAAIDKEGNPLGSLPIHIRKPEDSGIPKYILNQDSRRRRLLCISQNLDYSHQSGSLHLVYSRFITRDSRGTRRRLYRCERNLMNTGLYDISYRIANPHNKRTGPKHVLFRRGIRLPSRSYNQC